MGAPARSGPCRADDVHAHRVPRSRGACGVSLRLTLCANAGRGLASFVAYWDERSNASPDVARPPPRCVRNSRLSKSKPRTKKSRVLSHPRPLVVGSIRHLGKGCERAEQQAPYPAAERPSRKPGGTRGHLYEPHVSPRAPDRVVARWFGRVLETARGVLRPAALGRQTTDLLWTAH